MKRVLIADVAAGRSVKVPDIRGSKGRFDVVIGNANEASWSLEQLGRWYAYSLAFAKFIGSPQTVADQIQQWFDEHAADGFVTNIRSGLMLRPLAGAAGYGGKTKC